MRSLAKAFAGRAHKSRSDEVDAHAAAHAMELEIAHATAKFEHEKFELLEEIELREIREVSLRMDAERSELLAEIERREAQPSTPRERRHAIRIQKTLARNAARGVDATTQGDEVSLVELPDKRRGAVRRKNASLRAVSHNAARKNLWIAEV